MLSLIFYQKKFEQVASSEQIFSAILAEIEKAAVEADVRLADLKPRKVIQEDFYNRFPVSLTIDSPLF